ncbi:MAG: outer membrane beta-barrel protein [Gammaproteobacteria bacterium]|nr:outer membrane beta-barrel protein [Gammaproteobacteria bacterium]
MKSHNIMAIALCFTVIQSLQANENSNFSVNLKYAKAEHNSSTDNFLNSKQNTQGKGISFDYHLTPHISLSAGYVDFGKAQSDSFYASPYHWNDVYTGVTSARSKGKGITYSAKLSTGNIFSKTKFIFESGLIDWKVEQSYVGLYQFTSGDTMESYSMNKDKGSSPFYSYGLSYSLNDKVSLSLSQEHYKVKTDSRVYYFAGASSGEIPQKMRQNFTLNSINLSYHF